MFIIEIDPLCAWNIAYIMYTTIQKFGEVIFFKQFWKKTLTFTKRECVCVCVCVCVCININDALPEANIHGTHKYIIQTQTFTLDAVNRD